MTDDTITTTVPLDTLRQACSDALYTLGAELERREIRTESLPDQHNQSLTLRTPTEQAWTLSFDDEAVFTIRVLHAGDGSDDPPQLVTEATPDVGSDPDWVQKTIESAVETLISAYVLG